MQETLNLVEIHTKIIILQTFFRHSAWYSSIVIFRILHSFTGGV